MVAHNNQIFKVVIIGDSGVGKSCLLKQYMTGEFVSTYSSTIGVDFLVREKFVSNPKDDRLTRVKLQIWDTAGQERFRTIVSTYYRMAHGIILVYDVCNRESLEHVDMWMEEIKRFASPDATIVLVANKIDRNKHEVTRLDGQAVATRHNMTYFESSARDPSSLTSVINVLTNKMVDSYHEKQIHVKNDKKDRVTVSRSVKTTNADTSNGCC